MANRFRKSVVQALLVGLAVLLLATACNQRQPGCLDLEALNFDVEAEKNDVGECDYPTMFLNVTYMWADTIFRTGTVYTNDLGQDLSIDAFHYLFSQFSIQRSGAADLRAIERTEWYVDNPTPRYIDALDDFIFADRSTFNFAVGTITESGQASSCTFFTAVPDTLLPTAVDSISPESRIRANQYSFPLVKSLNRGYHDTIRIALDLEKLFGDVDLDGSAESILARLGQNFNESVLDNN